MIACEAVTKSLGGRRVLDAISAKITPGKVLGLIGPNGAGKSTLVRTLAAETRPDEGRVTIDGNDAAALSPLALAKVRAMLPQSPELVFDFTVRELVLLGRTPHAQAETKACTAMVDRCLAAVGLAAQSELPATSLSGGERQRAHLARVLAQIGLGETGRYLLLDEPVSNQDPAWQLRLLDVVREVSHRGVGVAVVLHDLNLAARSCDELALLRKGTVAEVGPPADVLRPALLQDVFEVEAHVDQDPWVAGIPRVTFRSVSKPLG
ncbi:MAG: heme ABC transporter ATP-binding protein [Polyangiaceae bacterium]|nr:heme ABC transporter ATP-binding protein [Polyangiaceae bacterium]